MTNNVPFEVSNIFQLLCYIKNEYRPKFDYPIPYCYKKLIEKCWSNSTYDRPSFSKIVKELETDPHFITSNVNKEEYLDYISYIKENEQTVFNTNNTNSNNESNNQQTQENHPKFKEIINSNMKINEFEDNNDDTKSDIFLDLSNYERKEIISKCDFSKIYKFKEKNTNDIYSGQMSMIRINKLSNEDIINLSNDLKNISELNHPSIHRI